tara:strand:- start:291 stop:527 length:237 start_codon:yes stop_codon:yes gene_type:complete
MNETSTMITIPETLSPKERSDWKKSIVEGISFLDEQEKLVIALFYLEELTIKEISQVLDMPEHHLETVHDKTIKKILR